MNRPTFIDMAKEGEELVKRFIKRWEEMKGDKPDPYIDKQIAELKKWLAK